MGPSRSPGETPELGDENASGLLPVCFFTLSLSLRWDMLSKETRPLEIESLAELAFCIAEYHLWRWSLPPRQQSPRTTDFRKHFKVASELDWKTGHTF